MCTARPPAVKAQDHCRVAPTHVREERHLHLVVLDVLPDLHVRFHDDGEDEVEDEDELDQHVRHRVHDHFTRLRPVVLEAAEEHQELRVHGLLQRHKVGAVGAKAPGADDAEADRDQPHQDRCVPHVVSGARDSTGEKCETRVEGGVAEDAQQQREQQHHPECVHALLVVHQVQDVARVLESQVLLLDGRQVGLVPADAGQLAGGVGRALLGGRGINHPNHRHNSASGDQDQVVHQTKPTGELLNIVLVVDISFAGIFPYPRT
mmetsp:Transcript_21525/g.36011  ORF Transcript_21525/g.36011 Transcript_21525/m.36011 type:complete len:263 (+) Transcript_21525:973-1761(+)